MTTNASTSLGTDDVGTDDEATESESSGSESGEDAGEPDVMPDLPPACAPAPAADADWIAPMQAELVARLSGAAELGPGVTLPDRASVEHRGLARDFLTEQWTALGFTVQLHQYAVDGANLYTTVEATTGSEQWMVFGAHFDSVPDSPGANDNATGVAMVLAASRFAAQIECRDVNWIFVLFDQEEVGLIGSAAFADSLVQTGVDVVAVHTVDQMGWDQDQDRAIELERPDAGLFELYADTVDQAALDVVLHQTDTGATDHVSFRARGFSAVGITEEYVNGDTTPHYHLPSDTYETVDLPYLRSTTVLFLELLSDRTWTDAG